MALLGFAKLELPRAGGERLFDRIFGWLAALLPFSLSYLPADEDLLEDEKHPLRRRLLKLVRERPGSRLSELWQTLRANRGTAQYHLLMLERAGLVVAHRVVRATRYFPPGSNEERLSLVALLLRGRVLEVAGMISRHPGISQQELTARLPMSRRVFRTYANLLVSSGLLEERRHVHSKRYFPGPGLGPILGQLESRQDSAPKEGPPPGESQAEGFD